ncbi:SpoIIIAH-like family protein [Paenibacillus sp. sgz302251]|uniref:SpoIIIAH-like family protein n=1 Tax=Paenibacillus sp. sgz302251 TaxID=3414493 RepID=UPI003C7AA835
MNTKRQTVWLVSMLSLMVVLSAYYLFTQDVDSPNVLTDGSQTEQAAGNAMEAAADDNGLVVGEVDLSGDALVLSEEDQDVLNQVDQQGIAAGGLFSELLAKREMVNAEEENRIMSVMADVQKKPEELTAAAEELSLLEEKVSKIAGLESELMEQYEVAVIDEENERYKVVVSSEQLEKKQAADIVKMVMSTMEVDADQISVQYVPQ